MPSSTSRSLSRSIRHTNDERRLDCYQTPPEATQALLRAERLPKVLWENSCGPGAIVRVLRAAGHEVLATDLQDYKSPDQDLAGFDFSASSADARLISELANLSFTDTAQNVVLIGGPGTGKTHLATALAVSGITRHGKRVRFYSTVDLVNLLEKEKRDGKAGRIALALMQQQGGDTGTNDAPVAVADTGALNENAALTTTAATGAARTASSIPTTSPRGATITTITTCTTTNEHTCRRPPDTRAAHRTRHGPACSTNNARVGVKHAEPAERAAATTTPCSPGSANSSTCARPARSTTAHGKQRCGVDCLGEKGNARCAARACSCAARTHADVKNA